MREPRLRAVTIIDARFWRMLNVRWQRQPMSSGAAVTGGRWNRQGQPALYLSADHGAAIAEFHQHIVSPGTLAAYDVSCAAIVDLTIPGAADEKLLFAEWRRIVAIDHAEPPTWQFADRLIADGAAGALVPSAQLRGGVNLVLWRWSDAPDGGALVRLVDPRGDLAPG